MWRAPLSSCDHTRMVVSLDPEYTVPSGSTARAITRPVWPRSVRTWDPSSPDQIRTVKSSDAAYTDPSFPTTRSFTPSPYPSSPSSSESTSEHVSSVCMWALVTVDHTVMLPSSPPTYSVSLKPTAKQVGEQFNRIRWLCLVESHQPAHRHCHACFFAVAPAHTACHRRHTLPQVPPTSTRTRIIHRSSSGKVSVGSTPPGTGAITAVSNSASVTASAPRTCSRSRLARSISSVHPASQARSRVISAWSACTLRSAGERSKCGGGVGASIALQDVCTTTDRPNTRMSTVGDSRVKHSLGYRSSDEDTNIYHLGYM
eukprot:m.399457 g.399457  ORF g.399457 m.399457 type:complete len:315 (+) comp28380_c3_seq13:136-1080(+)